ncbi:HNH endonuclease signature motif containing protein [Aeromicrobium sp. Leaf350]|uniref:HNH endonuclease signature motif containing protein n=1 Tax=Aeromicrobium sp. Leaf350 TaxID=2876565 RepID=UPI001E5EA813|nr:HNH endonuclease signature motif containing protein [Aeromicrobium sp. Leaf350]
MAKRTGPWVEVTRARARAEFAEWDWLLNEYEAGVAAIHDTSSWRQRSEEMGVVKDLALATGLSDRQVEARVSAMRIARDQLPMTWLAFRSGHLDSVRTVQLSNAAAKLERPDSHIPLDQRGSEYAATHTAAELRRWLIRFCAKIEPLETIEAAEKAYSLRHVKVDHDGDGMAWIGAFIPSPIAQAADNRLTQAARLLDDPDDDRTLAQKRADLLGSWLSNGDASVCEPRVHMDIAVTVPVEALAGHTQMPAAADDHSWTMPVDWLAQLAATANPLWHRIVHDPAGGVLDHTYLGRFAPTVLSTALAFRDGVCTTDGCTTPARRCEKDHLIPHPEGPTAGHNLDCKCRRCHRMKGSGVLSSSGLTRRRHSQPRAPDDPEPAVCSSLLDHHLAESMVEALNSTLRTAA